MHNRINVKNYQISSFKQMKSQDMIEIEYYLACT